MTIGRGRRTVLGLLLAVVLIGCGGAPAPSPTPMPVSPDASAPVSSSASAVATPVAGRPATPPPSPSGVDLDALDPVVRIMVDTISAQRPELRFELDPEVTPEAWALDGNADDGLGPGRLSVSVNRTPGALTAHPCGDPDFAQGAPCEERMLASGDLLVLRDLVDADGIRYINVALIRPDRSGLILEAANFRLDPPPDGPITPEDKRRLAPRATRRDPLYTVEQLGDLAVAIMDQLR